MDLHVFPPTYITSKIKDVNTIELNTIKKEGIPKRNTNLNNMNLIIKVVLNAYNTIKEAL